MRRFAARRWGWVCCLWLAVAGAERCRADDNLFSAVADILQRNCLQCHHGVTARGKLGLDERPRLMSGGESGPAIAAGSPDESLLVRMISGDPPEMPQDADPLAAREVQAVRDWIAAGAPWPEGRTLRPPPSGTDLWSLKPLVEPAIPVAGADWAETPIDAFIAAKHRQQGLTPTAAADRATLIRRVTFDLIGLPPTPEEVQRFLADNAPDAYHRLIDRLLASPQYGERWARHWLDVAHYGETHGYDKDKRRPNAWPYRDYVIGALNDDVPYGRFIESQIAGDVLWPQDPQAVIASSFVAAGPWDFVGHVELGETTLEKQKTRHLDRDDMVTAAISSFISLTVHCARCHDHPFDPIPQADYYRLQAVFAGVDRGDRSVATSAGEMPVYGLLRLDAPRPIHILYRGDVAAAREEVGPGALSAVAELPADFAELPPGDEGARRVALAHWLSDPRHPLTWRSIANRLWHYHFGRGLVDTPNDLGNNAAPPTHPELLDWLAVRLRQGPQSLKSLHRLIVTSATYQQASTAGAHAIQLDADNRFLTRMNRRRLEAEAIRDAALAVGGELDLRMGGPSFDSFEFEDDHSPRYKYVHRDKPELHRRTVYRTIVRSVPNPLLETLDCADASLSTPVRNTTITALQALALLNHPFLVEQAERLARRVTAEFPGGEDRLAAACLLALGRRLPAEDEAVLAELAHMHGLPSACRVILNLNEFVFID